MHPTRPRPSGFYQGPHASIPPTQSQALDRRHLLDEQQRAYQGTHESLRPTEPRRRPPS
jgi:hypothetical protein